MVFLLGQGVREIKTIVPNSWTRINGDPTRVAELIEEAVYVGSKTQLVVKTYAKIFAMLQTTYPINPLEPSTPGDFIANRQDCVFEFHAPAEENGSLIIFEWIPG